MRFAISIIFVALLIVACGPAPSQSNDQRKAREYITAATAGGSDAWSNLQCSASVTVRDEELQRERRFLHVRYDVRTMDKSSRSVEVVLDVTGEQATASEISPANWEQLQKSGKMPARAARDAEDKLDP